MLSCSPATCTENHSSFFQFFSTTVQCCSNSSSELTNAYGAIRQKQKVGNLMYIGMMDEDLQRVLFFLEDTLRRMPGWTHQGILKQELLAAPIDGLLHRKLGSSSSEMFSDFLKSFPNLFCINSNANQLVQLSSKKRNSYQVIESGFSVGVSDDFLNTEECCIGNMESYIGNLSLGLEKPHGMQAHPIEWSSSMTILPEMKVGKLGFVNVEPASSVPGNYTRECSDNHHYSPNVRGWDPAGFPLGDFQQTFLDSSWSSSSCLNHFANGWDQSIMVPSKQISHDAPCGQQHCTWDDTGSHTLTESLKNLTIENNNDYTRSSPHSLSSFGEPTNNPAHTHWMLMGNVGELDGYSNCHERASEANLLKNVSSVWDDSLRKRKCCTSTSQFGDSLDTAAITCRAPDTMNQQVGANCRSFKEWNIEEVPFSGFPIASLANTTQQFYGWKPPVSPAPITDTSPLTEFSSLKQMLDEGNCELKLGESPAVLYLEVESNSAELKEPKANCMCNSMDKPDKPQVEGIQLSTMSTPNMLSKSGTALSYAEALRSNAQRRRTDSENGSSSSCSGIVTSTSPTQSTLIAANCQTTLARQFVDKSANPRKSLDGRCGKVESVTMADGVLRLGSGSVFFDKNVFFDGGKAVSDLRSCLKINDTVYFNATLGANDYDWKSTLAWIGKKPRSTCSSTSLGVLLDHFQAAFNGGDLSVSNNNSRVQKTSLKDLSSSTTTMLDCTVEGNGKVAKLHAHFGFIRRGKRFKENVHFNRNVFYASGNRVKELTDTLKEGSSVNYIAVPSNKKSCEWKAALVWTGPRPKV